MSDVKHTPGPWRLEVNEKSSSISILGKHGDAGRCRASDGHGHIVIVDCADAMSDDTMFAPMLDEQCANARLIAAAPEMLEAALESIRQLDVIIADGIQTDWQAWRDDLASVVAKASGETP